MAPQVLQECACHCGQVEWTLHGHVVFSVLCHCRNCTESRSASPVHLLGVSPAECVQVTKGEEFMYTPPEGFVKRTFCLNCGAAIYQAPPQANYKAVYPPTFRLLEGGSRRLPPELHPTEHWNYESRTFDWHDPLPKYKGFAGSSMQVDNQGKTIKRSIQQDRLGEDRVH